MVEVILLVIIFEIDKNLKGFFYYIVLFFNLATNLGVEDYRKSLLNTKKVI